MEQRAIGQHQTEPTMTSEATGEGRSEPTARPIIHPEMVLLTICLCQGMVVLDASVVNIALPSIDAELGFSPGALSWVVNAYTLTFGGLLLLGGRIADFIGHRRATLWGLGLFGIASLLGGFAQDPDQLVAARAGQGVAAAVLAPVSLTVIMVTFPEGPARRRAIGIWAMVAAMGSALGVLLGGLLTDLLDWRWVLFVNVPIVALTAPLAWRSIHETRQLGSRRLDIPGAMLVTTATTLLVYAMVRAGENGWTDAGTLTALFLAALGGIGFAVWEHHVAAAPLVRLGIFATRTVWVANTIVVFIGAATIAGFYFASLFLQNVLNYSPLQAGLAFLPFCFGIVVGALASGKVATRFGYRATISTGLFLGAIGMFAFSRLHAESTFAPGFLLPSILASVGIGMCMVTNTTMGTSAVEHEEAGLVSGLLNTSRQLGGSVALAALTTLAVKATEQSDATNPLHAVVTGYQHAFTATAVLVLIAAVVALAFTPAQGKATTDVI